MKNESFRKMEAEWNKKLEAEGMPEELEIITPEEEHSPAFEAAVSDLYLHYATTATADHGVHRQALEALRERVRAGGGTDEETELLSEDFARDIEDAVTEIQRNAIQFARTISSSRPMLASRPDAVAKLVYTKLKQDAPPVISAAALTELASRAAATLQ